MSWLQSFWKLLFGREPVESSEEVKKLRADLAQAITDRDDLKSKFGALEAQLYNKDNQIRDLQTQVDAQKALIEAGDNQLVLVQAQLSEADGIVQKQAADNNRLQQNLLTKSQELVLITNDRDNLKITFTNPYSQDIPQLLKTMLQGDSAQQLSIPLKTRLRFDLAKIAFVALARQDIVWEEKDTAWVIAQLKRHFPNAQLVDMRKYREIMSLSQDTVLIHPPRDNKYRILKDRRSLEVIVESSFPALRPYVAEFRDCDDAAWELFLHAVIWWLVGSVFYTEDLVSMMHAYNIPLLSGEVLVVEPQNNIIMSIAEADKVGYKTSDIYP